MNFKTITFRQIFITLCILMLANICINLFQGSTTVEQKSPFTYETHKDFQLDYQHNGDILIYTMSDDGVSEYVGTYKHGTKCNLQSIMSKYLRDND